MSQYNRGGGAFAQMPQFTKFLLIANVAVFILVELFLGGLTYQGASISDYVQYYGALRPWGHGFQSWQFITYQYLHGSLFHLGFNMLTLWMFSTELERLWGSRRYAAFYTIAGIGAGALHLALSAFGVIDAAPIIGASGSIAGVLVAFAFTYPHQRIMMLPIFYPIPARIFVFIYLGMEVLRGVWDTGSGVAHFAHLGGAVTGYLLMKFGWPLLDWVDRIGNKSTTRETQRKPPRYVEVEHRDNDRPRAVVHPIQTVAPLTPAQKTSTGFIIDGQPVFQEDIDAILDKISMHGYHNLSEHEKAILTEVGKQM